jgi:hypothetical protein
MLIQIHTIINKKKKKKTKRHGKYIVQTSTNHFRWQQCKRALDIEIPMRLEEDACTSSI